VTYTNQETTYVAGTGNILNCDWDVRLFSVWTQQYEIATSTLVIQYKWNEFLFFFQVFADLHAGMSYKKRSNHHDSKCWQLPVASLGIGSLVVASTSVPWLSVTIVTHQSNIYGLASVSQSHFPHFPSISIDKSNPANVPLQGSHINRQLICTSVFYQQRAAVAKPDVPVQYPMPHLNFLLRR
jgi:hypothetical protein